MQFKNFLNTAVGSYLKVFISVVLSQFLAELMNGHDLFSFDWEMVKKLLSAGIVSILPIIINALNPADTRYGKGK